MVGGHTFVGVSIFETKKFSPSKRRFHEFVVSIPEDSTSSYQNEVNIQLINALNELTVSYYVNSYYYSLCIGQIFCLSYL